MHYPVKYPKCFIYLFVLKQKFPVQQSLIYYIRLFANNIRALVV